MFSGQYIHFEGLENVFITPEVELTMEITKKVPEILKRIID